MSDGWQVVAMTGQHARNTMTHPVMAVAPGCEPVPHPTRWCGCKPFPSRSQAQKYVDEREEARAS